MVVVSKNSTRIAGFAMLPINDPTSVAKELERCVRDLIFFEASVDNHVRYFYDNERLLMIFKKAEEMDVSIYIHPWFVLEDHFDQ